MSPPTLEGKTLGEKHKNFNKIVQKAIANKQINVTSINNDDTDIENLVKIDVASKTRNIEYIIEVLKCNDMLYISRAIKKSTWLFTEQEYIHIVNPDYLHTELFPNMLTKAVNKLLLNIRLNLKDENRIESFYTYTKHIGNNDNANKWLLRCSIPFIENVLQEEQQIPSHIYKRLCKRSIKFLKYYDKVYGWCVIKKVLFLLKSNTDEFLDVLDMYAKIHMLPTFSHKYTKIILKNCPNRIIENFEKYVASINLSVVAKHLKKEEIKDFLFKYMTHTGSREYFRHYEFLKPFITNMSIADKFDFVQTFFINKDQIALGLATHKNAESCTTEQDFIVYCTVDTYRWYEYAPFDIAFVEIQKLIRAEKSSPERCAMLSVLIKCAKNQPKNINILLQHYYDKHRNEPFEFKIKFVNNVVAQLATHDFDCKNWNILNTLFHTLEVYIESNNDVQSCIEAIVLYKVLHNEVVPDIINKKFQFNTLKRFQPKLNEDQQSKVFAYLLSFISTKIKDKTIENQSDLEDAICFIVKALQLLKDWNKCFNNYAFIIAQIQELLRIKEEKLWQVDFSSIYNVNKSFRKYMFEESVILCPGEEVCLNALKHEPVLLTRHSDVLSMLRVNDAISMPRLLAKLRVYWPHSLAHEWSGQYIKQMNKNIGHRATIEGLVLLLPQNELTDIVKQFVPEDSKINWKELDQVKFSLQKNIATHLYKARPLISLDLVLLYAKGDYLQYTLPSLSSILHNISKNHSVDYVTKLLNSTVMLQKYGLHLAFMKLKCDEVIDIFSNIWKSTVNTTIRTHIFKHTYNLLCKEKDHSIAGKLWNLLEGFIENTSTCKNKAIFEKLGDPERVPYYVQGQFYMKSYQYFTSLPLSANCETYINKLLAYAPKIMNILDEDFVADKLLSPIKDVIASSKYEYMDIISSFLLFGETEEQQCERFRRVLAPALEHAFLSWNIAKNNNQYVYKENVDILLRTLTWNFVKLLYHKKVVPVKLFIEIKLLISEKLPIEEKYVRYTSWNLTCEYVKLFAEHTDMFCDTKMDKKDIRNWLTEHTLEHIWESVHIKVSPLMGSIITKLLKEDTDRYFSTLFWLFKAALDKFFENLMFGIYCHKSHFLMRIETLKYMLINEEFIPSYIVVCYMLPPYGGDEVTVKRNEIREILSAHPSAEVQMHYHKAVDKII